jgi:hypothetical protein
MSIINGWPQPAFSESGRISVIRGGSYCLGLYSIVENGISEENRRNVALAGISSASMAPANNIISTIISKSSMASVYHNGLGISGANTMAMSAMAAYRKYQWPSAWRNGWLSIWPAKLKSEEKPEEMNIGEMKISVGRRNENLGGVAAGGVKMAAEWLAKAIVSRKW